LLALLFGAGVALVVMSVAVSIVTAMDAQGAVSVLGIGVLAAALAGHLLLIPRFGAVGAAMVTAMAGVAGGTASVALVHRLAGVRAYGTLVRAALVAAPAYWLAAHTPTSGGVALAGKLALLSAVVTGAFVALGELDAADRIRIRAAWPRRRLVAAESE
jgi:O-antigen/teichoic acid export membrane protein